MALFVDLVALSNGLHGSVQMDLVALFSWIGWLRHHGIFNVSHNLNEIIKLNGEVYCFIPKFKTIKKIQNEELIDNRFKDLIMFGADSYE